MIIRRYDWECAFVEAMKATLSFYESAREYLVAENKKLNLTNTLFFRTDKALSG
jgi:hypothetical protein